MPESEFFDQHGERPYPEIYEIKIDFDFFRRKGNFFVERVVYMDYRDMQDMEFLKILKEEKFLENRGKALEIGYKTRWPEKHASISDERIK